MKKKVIRLSESELVNLIKKKLKRIVKEDFETNPTLTDVIELLEELREYMEERADVVDRESNVDEPQAVSQNKEMMYQSMIENVLPFLSELASSMGESR